MFSLRALQALLFSGGSAHEYPSRKWVRKHVLVKQKLGYVVRRQVVE